MNLKKRNADFHMGYWVKTGKAICMCSCSCSIKYQFLNIFQREAAYYQHTYRSIQLTVLGTCETTSLLSKLHLILWTL